ncbi:hypothetical protein I3760_10G115200 [Carya illinoinensis]|nr:hypothetical protein I3760_10G115200 [Carya illinoinensis]
MGEEEALPDHLRCSRTDGRQWRCKRRVMGDMKLCEIHYLQGRHRQNKEKVPDSLKILRKSKKSPSKDPELQSRAQNVKMKLSKPMKRKNKSVRVSEALDEALRKMKFKKGNLQLELITMVLKRDLEKKKKETRTKKTKNSDSVSGSKKKKKMKRGEMDIEENCDGEELTRELPNGVMAISPAPSPSPRNCSNAGANCDVKVGVDTSVVRRRSFRSKNIEPLPTGTMQVLPYGQSEDKLRTGRRRKYFDTQEEVKMACPVCRGTCTCKDCLANQSNDSESKDSLREKYNVGKILHLHYLICMLLPVLKQINLDQSDELETEATTKGKRPSEVHIKQAEFGCSKRHCCNSCKTSIVDLHRSCPSCSYNLCLSCCRGSSPLSVDTFISKYSNRRKACMSGNKQLLRRKLAKRNSSTSLSPSQSNRKTCKTIGRIYCPPSKFGGCGKGLLDLRSVFPMSWIKELEVSAEEIVCSYEFPEALDTSSCCSLCLDMDHKAVGIEHLQEAAVREDSNDNFLYYPTLQEVHGDNLEHFQKHWGKGHPVVVRDILQTTSDLSWDPLVMFCTYLERSIAKYENNKDLLEARNCLNWCEVEIGIRQYFMGSLNGRTHANVWHEMFKLKGWLSSHILQEQFPSHYAEIINSLPLQEYMNPMSGLLNLAANLPPEIRKPDLGPFVYISYGCAEERVQADSVTKLCYDSYDVVNILAHTTDAHISTEQLTKIRKLLKRHKAQCQRESSLIIADKGMANEVNGRSSLNGEDKEDSGFQNVTEDELHLRKRVARVFSSSATSHERSAMSPKTCNMSYGVGYDSETDSDSEATLPCYESVLSSDTSDQRKLRDHTQSSNFYRKKVVSESSGAQWDVFRRQDVPKLIEYLERHSSEFSHMYGFHKQMVHPILDQSLFLDTTHKMRLKEEFEIEPWTFEQHVGEAVIIPAGCPYQIRNPKSCIHVVLDFLSPENVTECVQLTDEVRLLPDDHKAKIDKLEVKKMALHSISAAIKQIRELTCNM